MYTTQVDKMAKKRSSGHLTLRKILLVFVILLVIASGAVYTIYTFLLDSKNVREAAVLRAQSAALLAETVIFNSPSNEAPSERQKNHDFLVYGLQRYDDLSRDTSRIFVVYASGEDYRYLAGSTSPDGTGKVTPDTIYPMLPETKQTLTQAEYAIADQGERSGRFTVLVPMIDPSTGMIRAVFGVDYSLQAVMHEPWLHALTAVLITLIFLLLLLGIFYALRKNESLRETARRLRKSEERLKDIFEQAPIGIAIVTDYTNMTRVNRELRRILGYEEEEEPSFDWTTITHPDDLDRDVAEFELFKNGEISGYSMEKRYLRKDGSPVWVNIVVTGLYTHSLQGESLESPEHICIVQDIDEKKSAIDALRESERSKGVLLSNLPGMAYRCLHNREWTMQFMSDGCLELTGYPPEAFIENHELNFGDIISEEYSEKLWQTWKQTLGKHEPFRYEYEIVTKSGERKWVLEIGRGIYSESNEVDALEGIIIDITESKRNIDRIRYMNDHDFLTGLYNRKFYEEEKVRIAGSNALPVSIVNADINGVRLINDAFGQSEGDYLIRRTADIIRSCCRQGDILARIGGDEFNVLMPGAGEDAAAMLIERIRQACERHNEMTERPEHKINLTVAAATCSRDGQTLEDAEKEADDAVRKRKLFERKSTHSSLLSSILATLYARSQETEEHAMRIASLCREIGQVLDLPQKSLDNLQLFSMLHDIGKIGIEDRILNKPGKLTDEEWIIMKRHPEIGFRIVMSAPELEEIAQLVLSHHERWDGKGYPRGLKGEEIPLVSRILSVVDAFDAMTEDRVYRKAMSREDAVAEIRRNSGTQFDPTIVEIFHGILDRDMTENGPSGVRE